jgi:hypothetical protein
MNTAAMNAVGAEQRTRISGLLATTRQTSALFGLAILSSLGALLSRDDIHAPGNAQSIDAIQVGLYGATIVLLAAAAIVAWKLMWRSPAEPAAAPGVQAP